MADAEFFTCQCSMDAIRLESFDDSEVYVEFWGYGASRLIPWRERLKLVRKVLRGESPHADGVVLCPESARRLADSLRARVDAGEA